MSNCVKGFGKIQEYNLVNLLSFSLVSNYHFKYANIFVAAVQWDKFLLLPMNFYLLSESLVPDPATDFPEYVTNSDWSPITHQVPHLKQFW